MVGKRQEPPGNCSLRVAPELTEKVQQHRFIIASMVRTWTKISRLNPASDVATQDTGLDCPQGNSKGGGTNQAGGSKCNGGSNQKSQKERPPPRNKKFYCALHKDVTGHTCYSWSCTGLKYTPTQRESNCYEKTEIAINAEEIV